MERLSRILRRALEENYITRQDLYTDESAVIKKLPRQDWESFCKLSRVFRVDGEGEFAYRIPAKKRYIDPLTLVGKRASGLDDAFQKDLADFLSWDFGYGVTEG